MARLQMPPRTADLSRPPLSSHPSASTDTEAATQQFLTESQTSAAKPPRPAAVLGASLLNAARIRHPPDNPTKKAPTASRGKLKRPSILVEEQPQKNLATRGNLYDILLSPEKASFTLPETVNPQPLVVVRKPKRILPSAKVASSSIVTPRSAPDQIDQICLGETHHSGNLRCTAVYYRYDQQTGPHYQQCLKSGLNRTDAGPRCITHMQKPAAVRCRYTTVEDTATIQCLKPASKDIANGGRCPEHAETRHLAHTVKSSPKLSKIYRQKASARSPISKTQPQVQIPIRQSAKQSHTKISVGTDTFHNAQKNSSSPEEQSSGKDDFRGDQKSVEADNQRDMINLFKYLDLTGYPGKCQTKLGVSIKRTCKNSRLLVESCDLSIDAIVTDSKDVCAVLDQAGVNMSKEDRRSFKGDAYAHVFRAMTAYLQAVYIWSNKNYVAVTDALDVVRTLFALTQGILVLKDKIASWDVSLSEYYEGDKIIKDGDSKLIAPLRKVNETFRVRLRQLEATEQGRERREELKRKRAEDADEHQRRREVLAARKERWTRWQDLHIVRMQCEPDAVRRRKLRIMKPEALEEKDANGVEFERLPVFKIRSSPPKHQATLIPEDHEWTDAEEAALLEGLKSFAGPHVFEDVFRAYCCPGGELRSFNVMGIVAKAAWTRSAFMKLHQEKGWEVPTWIEQIPVLP